MENNNDTIRYIQARKRVKKIKGFYIHLGIYILVLCATLITAIWKQGHDNWSEITDNLIGMAFWGLGVAIHGLSVFAPDFILGKEWERRKIKEFMEKNKKN